MPYTIKTSVVKYRKDADHDYVGIDGFDASLIDDESTGDPRKSWSTQKLKQELDLKADFALKGAPEGLAELDASGKVPAIQLPSYVDDVLEGYVNPAEKPNYTHFYKNRTALQTGGYGYSNPYTPETGKIYVDLPTGKCYRWGGSVYAEVSNNDASVIAIERNNLVFTATRADGTTFTFTQQDMDTKNTAGTIENLDKKMYLVGAETQATSPQTRSNSKCFIGADNKLRSNDDVVLTDGQIDDTAGDGDKKKLWSADKSYDEITSARAYAKQYVDGWMTYLPIAINSLSVSPASSELSSTVTSVTFTLKTNKEAIDIKLDGVKLVSGEGNVTIASSTSGGVVTYAITKTNLSITANKTWTVTVTDKRPDDVVIDKSANATLTFMNHIYYGAAADPTSLDSSFVRSLANSPLATSRAKTFDVNAGSNQRIWYAVPVRLGACTFSVGGFTGGFSSRTTLAVTNGSGHTEDYYVYKSDNKNLGQTRVVVS